MSKYAKRRNKKKLIALYFTAGVLVLGIFLQLFFNNSGYFLNDIFNVISPSYSSANLNLTEYDMSVHVLDVGKADAIYINCKDKNILIDAGDVELTDVVSEYLEKMKVDKLDLVIVSHPHRDHIGGMTDVINKFPIDEFMMPEVPDDIVPTTRSYESMINALYNKGLTIKKPIAGESFNVGDLQINIFAPIKKYDNLNNNSIVAQFVYGNDSFLFMGDAEKQAERDIISSGYNLRSTVLKVGHHGSASSTTNQLIQAVDPNIAVISVGNDSNKLPKDSTIDRLKSNGIKILRTDINGNIIFLTNGDGVSFIVEKE